MKVGASQYHPGLTVRWERGRPECVLVSRLGEHHSVCESTRSPSYNAKPLYVVFAGTCGPVLRKPFTRRCDAKRAAEVLVGQWWREKCEREAAALDAFLDAVIRGMMHTAAVIESPFAVATLADLDRLAKVFGVERREPVAPVQYTFRAEGAENVTAAFRRALPPRYPRCTVPRTPLRARSQ